MNVSLQMLSANYLDQGSFTIRVAGWPKETEVCPNARSYRAHNLRRMKRQLNIIQMLPTTHLN